MKIFVAFLLAFCTATLAIAQEPAAATPAMGWLEQVKFYVEILSQVVFGLTILATIVVRVIPGKKDDAVVSGIAGKASKLIHMLPTWGINPKTKELEAALEAMSKQNDQQPGSK